jgi:hypothetical protein
VIRNVSEDFCADAGAAIESVPQAASSAPRSQLFERICCPFDFNAAHAEQCRERDVTIGSNLYAKK